MSKGHKVSVFEVKLPLPNKEVELAGYFPARQWDGTGDDIRAAFILFESETDDKILFMSLDVLYIDTSFKDDLSSKLGNDYSLILVATHTHSAPNLAKSVESLGHVDQAWYEQVLETLVTGIKTTTNKSDVDQIKAGVLSSNLNVNRRRDALMLDYGALKHGSFKLGRKVALAPNSKGPIDNHVRSICFSDMSGTVRACLWSFSAHPTFEGLGGLSQKISPDFPGIVRRRIKAEYGKDCVSLFLPGLAGSAILKCKTKSILKMSQKERLLYLLPLHPSIPPFDSVAYQAWADKLASQVIDAPSRSESSMLDNLVVTHRSSDRVPIFEDKTRGEIYWGVNALLIGDVAAVIVGNGEMLAEWKPVIGRLLANSAQSIISGYGAGDCLYVPPDGEISRGGYEVEGFKSLFGLNGDFYSGIDSKVLASLKQVL
ncbi:MAG: hypothetical protein OQL20_03740 [Sedimenticola sp.]|nr:hypothetical protein [Sedimenticola sp.]